MRFSDLLWILASGAATGIGALFLFVVRRPSDRLLDILTGFTAGVMLAATSFSLLVPALERGGLMEVTAGILLGGLIFAALDHFLPHLHMRFSERGQEAASDETRRGWLLLSALTIHNIPEGLAVGVAFAGGGAALGVPLALAIGIQNVPEGFAAGAPLMRRARRKNAAAAIAGVTGLVEPPAALAAFAALDLSTVLLPSAFGFAAGAMLYVVVDELIPESHARDSERSATLALLGGFALMLTLDNAFG